MKYFAASILILLTVLSGQFSSGVDYSLKEIQPKSTIGAGFLVETGKTEWAVAFGDAEKFKAVSEVFGAGYEIWGENRLNDFTVDFNAGQMFRSVTNSASLDSAGTVSNFTPKDLSFQSIRAQAGLLYLDTYGIYIKTGFYSDDDDKVNVFGMGAVYKLRFSDRKKAEIFYEMNFGGEDSPAGIIYFTGTDPGYRYGLIYTVQKDNSELSAYFDILSYIGDAFNGIAENYFHAEMSYKYFFHQAGSAVSASAGSYLSSEFDTPEIGLPFFYYSFSYENILIKDRLDLTVGWDFDMSVSNLRTRSGFSGVIPSGISSSEINETSGVNRLYIKLNFRY
jgi:hypothetical protein